MQADVARASLVPVVKDVNVLLDADYKLGINSIQKILAEEKATEKQKELLGMSAMYLTSLSRPALVTAGILDFVHPYIAQST
jgi:hypothetical protein